MDEYRQENVREREKTREEGMEWERRVEKVEGGKKRVEKEKRELLTFIEQMETRIKDKKRVHIVLEDDYRSIESPKKETKPHNESTIILRKVPQNASPNHCPDSDY